MKNNWNAASTSQSDGLGGPVFSRVGPGPIGPNLVVGLIPGPSKPFSREAAILNFVAVSSQSVKEWRVKQ